MLIRLRQEGVGERELPLHRQIYEELRNRILRGELEAGQRLPSSRDLANDLSVSRNVVVCAYEQLLAEGYVEGRVGAGTFVAALSPELVERCAPGESAAPTLPRGTTRLTTFAERALAQRPFRLQPYPGAPPRYNFQYGGGEPDSQSLKIWRRLLTRHTAELCYNYGATEGHPALRREIARYLLRNRGVRCDPEQVIVVNGSQQGLDLTTRVLIDPGDAVLIEEPHYQGARKVFLAAGAELVAGPVDGEGLDIRAAPPTARRARLIYVTPSHQFPTGAVMSLKRRLALLERASEWGAYILEDDYDSEFRYEGRPVEAVQGLDRNGRTIYLGTLSKVLSPTLRQGYAIVPHELVEVFRAAKWLCDRHAPTLDQAVLADFMAEGHFERHLRRMRTKNARRRAALIDALGEFLGDRAEIVGTNAGAHLLVWLPGLTSAALDALILRAVEEDVAVYPASPYFLSPPARAGLLLGYSTLSSAEIREGMKKLGSLLLREWGSPAENI